LSLAASDQYVSNQSSYEECGGIAKNRNFDSISTAFENVIEAIQYFDPLHHDDKEEVSQLKTRALTSRLSEKFDLQHIDIYSPISKDFSNNKNVGTIKTHKRLVPLIKKLNLKSLEQGGKGTDFGSLLEGVCTPNASNKSSNKKALKKLKYFSSNKNRSGHEGAKKQKIDPRK